MMTLIIAVHAIAAAGVVLLAPVQLIRRPKDNRHKTIGRSWVVLMYLVCVSGMFIYSLTGAFTVFHALAIYTFATTTLGVIAIRRGNVRRHIGMMVGSYLGALTAGIFAAAVPGREIPQLAVSDPGLLWSLIAVIIVAVTTWAIFVLRFVSGHDRQLNTGETAEKGVSGEPLTPSKLSNAAPVTAK